MNYTSPSVLLNTELPLPLFSRGKVRDSYDLGELLLIIATDRISAFDVVLPVGIPRTGLVLNQLSVFWFDKTKNVVPNHLVATVDDVHRGVRVPTRGKLVDPVGGDITTTR